MAENSQPPVQGWAAQVRSLVPSVILTVLVAFATSWWNAQVSQNQTLFRLTALEKAVEVQQNQITQNAALNQQNAIRMAEIARDQLNIAEQVREIRTREAGRR